MIFNCLATNSAIFGFITALFLLLNYNFSLIDLYQKKIDKKRVNNIVLTMVTLLLPFASSFLIENTVFLFKKNMNSGFYTILGAIVGGIIGFLGSEISSRRQQKTEHIKRLQDKLELLFLLNEELLEEINNILIYLFPLSKPDETHHEFNQYIIKNKLNSLFEENKNQDIEHKISKIKILSKLYFPNLLDKIKEYQEHYNTLCRCLAMIEGNLKSHYSDNNRYIKDAYIDRISENVHQAHNKHQDLTNQSKKLEELMQKEAEQIGITPMRYQKNHINASDSKY